MSADESLADPSSAAPGVDDDGADDGAPKKRRRREGCLTRITPVTTPGCASCLTTVFLVTTVVTVWIAFLLDPNNVPWRHSMSLLRIVTIGLLVIAIPLVVHTMIRWWLDGERSRFPDLDAAWQIGLEALAANGISLASTPLYVVFGSSGEAQERALLAAAGLRLRVEGAPEGPSPLHWYGNTDGIYLFCTDASWSSAIASLREELLADAAGRGLTSPDAFAGYYPMTAPPETPAAPAAETPRPDGGDIRGTLMLDQFLAQTSPPPRSAPPPPENEAMFRGTLNLTGPISGPIVETAVASRGATSDVGEPDKPFAIEPALVAPQYVTASLHQLQYLGELLRRAREPQCAMNGVLMLLQFESIHATPAEMDELQKAIRADLATWQYATRLRAPITALIVGLEKERGFRELVRRVGKERAISQRFGRKFDVRAIPTGEDLAALSAHVCGAFEDWAYALFREDDALTRPGNTRLYELLSKVRCSWKTRLGDILAGGFGCEMTAPHEETNLFSGCYLAATGETRDRQAFVKGVFDKLSEEQELVEWTAEAVQANRRQSRLTNAGMLLTLFMAFTLLVMYFLGWLK